MKNVVEKLDSLFDHQDEESREFDNVHPDGCYYCGGNHPSDMCQDPERDHFYEANK